MGVPHEALHDAVPLSVVKTKACVDPFSHSDRLAPVVPQYKKNIEVSVYTKMSNWYERFRSVLTDLQLAKLHGK